jgi:trk system potassium uptake protein TrkA
VKIIILGAGQVGTSVAANLVSEANDITVVDQNPDLLRELQDRFDLRTILGHGAHPDVLLRAGAEDADMIIAVTNSDETNMVACQVAYTLFHTPTKIARVRSQGFLDQPKLFGTEALPIDVPISPEALVTDYILRLIENPGALQVLDFAGGRVRLVAVKAYYGGPPGGSRAARALRPHAPCGCPGGGHLSTGPGHPAPGRHRHRGGRRGLLRSRPHPYPRRHERAAAPGQAL